MKNIALYVGFVSFLAAPLAQATVIFQTGFEAPTYTTGTLNGQNSWGISPVPVVESGVANSGSQAVQVAATGTTGQNLDDHGLSYTAIGNPENVVTFNIAFMQSTTGTSSLWDVMAVFGSPAFIGQVLQGNGVATLDGLGSVAVDTGVWNDYQMVLNFTTQTTTAYVNGQFIANEAFENPATGLNPFQGIAFGINSSPGTDTGYFDDLSIVSSAAVPEPSSSTLLAIGLAAATLLIVRKTR